MEALKAGEALLRSSQLIPTFLAPSAYRASSSSRRAAISCINQRTKYRALSTTSCYQQQQRSFEAPESRAPRSSASNPSRSGVSNDIASLLDGTLDQSKDTATTPASRNSRFSSRIAQQQNPPSRGIANELQQNQGRPRSSVDDLLDNIAPRAGSRQDRAKSQYGSSDIMAMLDPYSGADNGPPAASEQAKPIILPKNVGRLVEVNEGRHMDVGKAFRTMEAECRRNAVRRDFMAQRFHERPGMKRKRLKRQRWAQTFKSNFVKTVQMVQRMNKQGW